jgi:hypothetical protein
LNLQLNEWLAAARATHARRKSQTKATYKQLTSKIDTVESFNHSGDTKSDWSSGENFATVKDQKPEKGTEGNCG